MYITQLIKLAFNGYIAYIDPTKENNKIFARSLRDIFNNENDDKSYSYELDEGKDIIALENDNAYQVCQICTVNKRNVVILPCSHSITCIKCFKAICNSSNKCPVCRTDIKNKVFYFSS